MMSSFEYPRLSRREIIMLLAESRIASISEAELIWPTSDFVMDIYLKLRVYLDLLHGEDQGQLEFAALENLERHFDSVRIMNLWNKIKEILEAISCLWKFTLKNLLKPDGDWTEFFVSSIVNFVLHKDTKVEQLMPIVEELLVLQEQASELEERIVEINSEIGKYNELREKETPILRELESQLQKLTQNISNHNNHQRHAENFLPQNE